MIEYQRLVTVSNVLANVDGSVDEKVDGSGCILGEG